MAISLKDIAREAGTSNVTVSLALRDHPRISLKRREQIKKLAEQMGYRPDPVARAMRTRRSLTVGLLMSNLQTGVANLKIDAIEHRLVAAGYRVLLGFTDGDPDQLRRQLEEMIDRRADGVIIYGHHGQAGDWKQLRQQLKAPFPPCVLADAQADAEQFAQIDVDRTAGTATLTRHLLELGHRNILFVRTADALAHKWEGVQHAAAEWKHGPVRTCELVIAGQTGTAEQNLTAIINAAIDTGHSLGRAAKSDRPTAIVAASDVIAMAVIRGLSRAGVRVPEDISVCGFDGDDIAALLFEPSLTTIHQPREELADQVVRSLLALLCPEGGGPASATLRPSLILGKSTGPLQNRPKR